jgi:hypothetical protein
LRKREKELGRSERKTKKITSRRNEKNQTSALERGEEGTFSLQKETKVQPIREVKILKR